VAGLATSFGRGAMTNHWVDLKNADVIMINGSNAAENHPASMTWIHKAIDERGAKLIVVDPRFTRSASQADLYAPIRSGTDIAFYGGLMEYIMDHNLYHKDYVVHYTNAATLVVNDFKGPVDLDGLFSGFVDEDGDGFGKYDRRTWKFQTNGDGKPLRDETLQNPHCVFQIMKKHYSRYTLDTVSAITGCPKDKLEAVYKLYASTGSKEKTGTILYAMGQTQHTVGSQNVRCMAMVQLLLGNVGRPGGGVNALRGESNVQGSTDMALLAHLIPAYMAIPRAADHPTLAAYIEKETPKTSYWANKPKFLVSLLKAWWGEHATAENQFAYDYLPKVESPANHYWIKLFEDMYAGKIQGLWILGQNPAVSGPNARLEREGLKKLKWMVIQELFDTETCSFWRAPGVKPADIQTEVFVLPAADAMEKEGSIVTSGRLIQWRPKVARAPGMALPDHQISNLIALKLKELYAANPGPFADPIVHLNWDYGKELDIEKVAREVNGYALAEITDAKGNVLAKKGEILKSFGHLQRNGTTACGNWLYTGYFALADDGTGRMMPATKRRGQKDPGGLGMYPFWAFSWPANRRIIYNRCSADPNGKPWSEDKKLIWWDEGQKKWTGYDVPDFAGTKAPTAPGGRDPFIMRGDGKGALFGALNEGPFPEHYEPVETPVEKNPFSSRLHNPVIKIWKTESGKTIGDNWGKREAFPIVATTYRVVEHWQAGGMSRWLEWLTECQPQMFVEMSKELAAEKGIQNGARVKVRSARGEIQAVAIVTARFKPFQVNGKTVHQVGMPWHFGWGGLATGDPANDLTPHVGDGNTTIPEYKAFLVDVKKA
jgi:formate dehydrogenase major subunit